MMQRKPGFPVANCSIRMPENLSAIEPLSCEEDGDQQQRRQQLINFGHSQWGFNNWNWSVTKQELDFVDVTSGKYCAGVVAFVSVAVKSLDIHRENIGYATSVAGSKGLAIHRSRKVAVTNALRETLLSFGGAVATELTELLETNREAIEPQPDNQNTANIKEPPLKNVRRDDGPANIPPVQVPIAPIPVPSAPVIPPMKNAAPIAKAHPMPANTAPPRVSAPAPRPAPPPLHRPNSNEGTREATSEEEEARAERKRRQRQAQEEFRLKQLVKQQGLDDKPDKNASLDKLMMEIPTQDIVIEETGASAVKRKSPTPTGCSKRRASISRLDILLD